MVKDKFVSFMKQNKAMAEYEDTLLFCRSVSFDEEWESCADKAELLSDGRIFWTNGITDIDWEELDKKWRNEIC